MLMKPPIPTTAADAAMLMAQAAIPECERILFRASERDRNPGTRRQPPILDRRSDPQQEPWVSDADYPYLHPADPVSPFVVLDGYTGLKRATWEWTLETGSHALRMVFGGFTVLVNA